MQIARRACDAGAFVAIAHPQWSGLSHEDAMNIDAAHTVEIYNHSSYSEYDQGDGLAVLDLLLRAGRELNLCATDDAHCIEPDAVGGWVVVKAENSKPNTLLAAQKNGHHDSRQGPDFRNIQWHGGFNY